MTDLFYCKGSNKEKTALLEKRQEGGLPKQQVQRLPSPKSRRSGGGDIQERMKRLEKAMSRDSDCTQPVAEEDVITDKNDPDYGKPQAGTKTEARGRRAQTHVHKEILELCEVIYMNGSEEEDGMVVMSFGDLFRIYTRISDKVVGMLLRARKYGLVYFEAEMLFQGQNDDDPIVLVKPMKEIYDHYNENKCFVLE